MTTSLKNHKLAIALWGRCLTSYELPPDWAFIPFLKDFGITVVALEDPNAEALVCFDHYSATIKKYGKKFGVENRMLVVYEPNAVHPLQHRLKTRLLYSRTLVAAPRQVISPADVYVKPGTLGTRSQIEARSRKIQYDKRLFSVGILNENKFSFVPGNLYKYRVTSIKSLAQGGIDVHLGGGTWRNGFLYNMRGQFLALGSLLKNRLHFDLREFNLGLGSWKNLTLHGRVPDSIDFFLPYEFALIIENDPDYISEKLLNAVQAGCVPLFVGPPLQEFDLPAEMAIQISQTRDSALKAVRHLSEEQREKVKIAGRKFLASEKQRQQWSNARYQRDVAWQIAQFAEKASVRN